jgi:hypothetical protein
VGRLIYVFAPPKKGRELGAKVGKSESLLCRSGGINFLTAVRKRDCIVVVCNNRVGKKMVSFGKIKWCHFNCIFPCCHSKNRNGVIKKKKVV